MSPHSTERTLSDADVPLDVLVPAQVATYVSQLLRTVEKLKSTVEQLESTVKRHESRLCAQEAQ